MFYTFNQNNTGGAFDLTEALTHFVIVEAESADEANAKLIALGGYFDGCSIGRDCWCCGDRWYPAREGEGSDAPEVYDRHPRDYDAGEYSKRWMPAGKEIVVHHEGKPAEWF
ncbi:DUF7296 family protein [Paracoccus sulfuroxidans]|nr:hypothetical protein [Paracoccus sulfuroxidans]